MNYLFQCIIGDEQINNINYYLRERSFWALDEGESSSSKGESDHEEVEEHFSTTLFK